MDVPSFETFRYCPACGVKASGAPANPFRCEACGHVHYFSPTAAVGAILVNPQAKVLFLVRGKDPGKGLLGLPGGFADPGESLEDSLKREVQEETALRVGNLSYLCSFPNPYAYRGVVVDVLDAFYVGQVPSFDGVQAQEQEVAGVEILTPSPEVLERVAFESNRRAIERYLNRQG